MWRILKKLLFPSKTDKALPTPPRMTAEVVCNDRSRTPMSVRVRIIDRPYMLIFTFDDRTGELALSCARPPVTRPHHGPLPEVPLEKISPQMRRRALALARETVRKTPHTSPEQQVRNTSCSPSAAAEVA